MHLSELKSLHVSKLLDWAIDLGVENANRMRKQELMFSILKKRAKDGEQIFGDGTLEILPDGFAASVFSAAPKPLTSPALMIFTFLLHKSDVLTCTLVTPLKVKYALRKKANVISPLSKLKR